ncbi:MAG: NAD(P)H-dependent glycerol-3-phosphate dehydrogenase [Actinomycetota bacterium]
MAGGELKVGVVGAGSWGTAFATIPASNGIDTVVWARRQDLADAITSRHECPDYLPGIELPPALRGTHDLEEALSGAKIVVMAIPSHAFRDVLKDVAPHVSSDASMVSLTKGLEQGSQKRMTEVMRQEIDLPPWAFGTLTGPNLAKEIAAGQPAAAVIGSEDEESATAMQQAFMSNRFRVYTNEDVAGCELGGAIKNVIAIAAGIGDGMGFGDNSKAALITRGFAEMARLGVALGGKALTFAGLAGMGDLIATCTSPLSRNRHVGEQLGKGRKLDEIIAEMNMVAEGVKTSRVVAELGDRVSVPMPISEHVVKVVHEGMSPEEALLSLMTREAEPEFHGLDE